MIPNKTSKSPGSLWIKKKGSKFKSKSRFSDFLTRKLTCSSKLSISFIVIIYYNYYLFFFCFLPKVFFITKSHVYIYLHVYIYILKRCTYTEVIVVHVQCTPFDWANFKFGCACTCIDLHQTWWLCLETWFMSAIRILIRSEMSKEVYRGCKTILFFAF